MDEHDQLMKSFGDMRNAFDRAPPECNDFELASHYAGLIIKSVPVLDQEF